MSLLCLNFRSLRGCRMIEIIKVIAELYLFIALVMGLVAVIANNKALVKMSVKRQVLFFILQPILLIREIIQGKKDEIKK